MNRIAWALKLYKRTIYRSYSQALLGQNEDLGTPAAGLRSESILFQSEMPALKAGVPRTALVQGV